MSDAAALNAAFQNAERDHRRIAELEAERDRLREVLREGIENAEMSLPRSIDPEYGAEIEAFAERIGYGALMSSAAASWLKRHGEGAFCCGPCVGTARAWIDKARAALLRALIAQEEAEHSDLIERMENAYWRTAVYGADAGDMRAVARMIRHEQLAWCETVIGAKPGSTIHAAFVDFFRSRGLQENGER